MNLSNALLQRVDAPAAPNAFGEATAFVEGASIAVRCVFDTPTFATRRLLGATIKDASGVVYVQGQDAIRQGYRLLVKSDGEATARLWLVVHVVLRVKGSLTHVEAYGQEVA